MSTPPPEESFGLKLFGRVAVAIGWGFVGGIALAVTAAGADFAGLRLYNQSDSHYLSLLLYVPLAFVAGFGLTAGMRLARPRWTPIQMFIAVTWFAALCAVGILQLNRWDSSYQVH